MADYYEQLIANLQARDDTSRKSRSYAAAAAETAPDVARRPTTLLNLRRRHLLAVVVVALLVAAPSDQLWALICVYVCVCAVGSAGIRSYVESGRNGKRKT